VANVGTIFREYGDVTVVKQSDDLFWIDFEEFTGDGNLDTLCELMIAQNDGQFTLRRFNDAIRFKC